jgi:hypothetical protein
LHGVERFFPLRDDTVFAYETSSDSGEKGLLVLEVRRRRPEAAELIVAGRVQPLTIDETGIRHATGGWILKEPLALGARWKGDFGDVQVTALDRRVTVPAGTFDGCVETVEVISSSAYEKRTTTAFCPDVGIATRRTEAHSDEGSGTESLTLRSFGPRWHESAP